jgi:hypothetical protein
LFKAQTKKGCPQGQPFFMAAYPKETGRLFFMTDAAFGQVGIVLLMAILTQGMGSILERVDFFRHSSLAVMAGFAFFDFLSLYIRDPFALRAFAVMTGLAFKPCLMRTVRELGGFRGLGRIKGGLQGDLRWALIRGRCQTHSATKSQDRAKKQQFSHVTPPSFNSIF